MRWKMKHHEAEDLCQEFFASVVLKRNLMEAADRKRGRRRSLLLTALDRFLVSHLRSTQTARRGGGAG